MIVRLEEAQKDIAALKERLSTLQKVFGITDKQLDEQREADRADAVAAAAK